MNVVLQSNQTIWAPLLYRDERPLGPIGSGPRRSNSTKNGKSKVDTGRKEERTGRLVS